MWRDLAGCGWGYAAGTSGTATLPKSATVLRIIAHASAGSATVAINGGTAIPVINGAAPLDIQFNHDLVGPTTPGSSPSVVFTNTDSYMVEYITTGFGA